MFRLPPCALAAERNSISARPVIRSVSYMKRYDIEPLHAFPIFNYHPLQQ
jgi:hypothetical protein